MQNEKLHPFDSPVTASGTGVSLVPTPLMAVSAGGNHPQGQAEQPKHDTFPPANRYSGDDRHCIEYRAGDYDS